jgi:inhibitor of KinA sporulation pathway (predicted exonuclease)
VVASGWFAIFNSVFNLSVSRAIHDYMANKKPSKNPAAVALGRMDRNFIERQWGKAEVSQF